MYASKYLLAIIWSLAVLSIRCEKSANEASDKQDSVDALIGHMIDEKPTASSSSLSSNDRKQRFEILKNLLEALEEDITPDDEFYYDQEADSSEGYLNKDKRSSPLQKKDDQQLRRQAARWDIGFGKRVPPSKSKAFMDALYGKRSAGFRTPYNPRTSYGRRQQWDLQYGRK